MKKKMPKLTLKAAKALAIQELGTAKGIIAHEDNTADYQRYEMKMGNNTVVIANECGHWGLAYILFGNKWTYYDINTLQENYYITEAERLNERCELIRDMASCNSGYMFEALVEIHGTEECRRMIDKTVKKLYGTQ